MNPSSPASKYVFEELNRDQRVKKCAPVRKYETLQQKRATEAALRRIYQAGQAELERAVNWALGRERTSRLALCATLVSWARNLDRPRPRTPGIPGCQRARCPTGCENQAAVINNG